jgi:prephenate dehydrogenase
MQHDVNTLDLNQFVAPLETAATSIAQTEFLITRAIARGNDEQVIRLRQQVDRIEEAVARYLEQHRNGEK